MGGGGGELESILCPSHPYLGRCVKTSLKRRTAEVNLVMQSGGVWDELTYLEVLTVVLNACFLGPLCSDPDQPCHCHWLWFWWLCEVSVSCQIQLPSHT